jgi:hypothetical protein
VALVSNTSRSQTIVATRALHDKLTMERTERTKPKTARFAARAVRSRFSRRRDLASSRSSDRAWRFRLRSSEATKSLSQRS